MKLYIVKGDTEINKVIVGKYKSHLKDQNYIFTCIYSTNYSMTYKNLEVIEKVVDDEKQ